MGVLTTTSTSIKPWQRAPFSTKDRARLKKEAHQDLDLLKLAFGRNETLQKDHEDLVARATRIFCGSKVIADETCETARQRCFDYLKAENKHPDPVQRWKTACHVMMDVLTFADEPYVSWANMVLDGYLTDLLAKLHGAGKILDHPKPWPGSWPDKFKDNCPF